MGWLELAKEKERELYEAACEAIESAINDRSGAPNRCCGVQLFEDGRVTVAAYSDFGFPYEISPFGGREYAINAVPHNLYGIASQDLFVEVLDHLEEVGEKPLDIITEKLASMSCKAAVKGNHALSFQEVERLIDELLTLEDPYHCPHGRPTIISISRQEMEKKFKRIV